MPEPIQEELEVKHQETKRSSPINFGQIAQGEIKKMVIDEGPCRSLLLITPRIDSFGPYLQKDVGITGRKMEYSTNLDQETEAVRLVLPKLLEDNSFLELVASKGPTEEISRAEIKNFSGSSDEDTIERIYLVLNRNLDPELIPFVIEDYCQGKYGSLYDMPQELATTLKASGYLRNQLANLLTDGNFLQEFTHRQKRQPYSAETLKKITEFINLSVSEQAKYSEPTEVGVFRIRNFCEGHFFDMYGYYDFWNSNSAFTLDSAMSRITAAAYFDFDEGESLDRTAPFTFQIRESLIKYAKSLEAGKYLLGLYKQVEAFYRQAFPEIFVESGITGIRITEPLSKKEVKTGKEPEKGIEEANGSYEQSVITVKSGTFIESHKPEEILEEMTVSFAGVLAKRKVIETITLAHELTHAIYEQLVMGGPKEYPDNYEQTADHAVNEGFCVLMELLFIDLLKQSPQVLGLDEEDIQALETNKQARLYKLKQDYNGYAEGTYRILHKVYQQAAGPITSRNVHQGLLAVREFIESLDSTKTLGMLRTDSEYQSLLKAGDPVKWKNFFQKK